MSTYFWIVIRCYAAFEGIPETEIVDLMDEGRITIQASRKCSCVGCFTLSCCCPCMPRNKKRSLYTYHIIRSHFLRSWGLPSKHFRFYDYFKRCLYDDVIDLLGLGMVGYIICFVSHHSIGEKVGGQRYLSTANFMVKNFT